MQNLIDTMASDGVMTNILTACLQVVSFFDFNICAWESIEPIIPPVLKIVMTSTDDVVITMACKALRNLVRGTIDQIKSIVETSKLNRYVSHL